MGRYIHVVIKNTENFIKYIYIVRKYNNDSIGNIKSNIQLQNYVVSFDWEKCDLESGDYIKPKQAFRAFVHDLVNAGARLSLFEEFDGTLEEISIELIDQFIKANLQTQCQLEWEDKQVFKEVQKKF